MLRLLSGPVRHRLEWVLDGLDGTPGWGADAAEVFAPEYTSSTRMPGPIPAASTTSAPLTPAVTIGKWGGGGGETRQYLPMSCGIAHC